MYRKKSLVKICICIKLLLSLHTFHNFVNSFLYNIFSPSGISDISSTTLYINIYIIIIILINSNLRESMEGYKRY